ncbi:hypothetical protein [Beijerinckia mobilis]|uniref:hypothetical protein n=1 Tax=Beijerinckia mobilis TaxID=231434 RepID=UPI0012EB353C|nr:hypothetical protein [Beijerinckia mobilis]
MTSGFPEEARLHTVPNIYSEAVCNAGSGKATPNDDYRSLMIFELLSQTRDLHHAQKENLFDLI